MSYPDAVRLSDLRLYRRLRREQERCIRGAAKLASGGYSALSRTAKDMADVIGSDADRLLARLEIGA